MSVHAVPLVLANSIDTSVGVTGEPLYLTARSTAGSTTVGVLVVVVEPGAIEAAPVFAGGWSGSSCSHLPAHSW